MSLDLEKHFVFYGAYHNDSVNIAIHMFWVPVILASGFCMASYTGTLINTPSWLTIPYLDLNLGTLAAFTWASLYVLLEPVAGTALAVLVMLSAAFGNYWRLHDADMTFKVALGSHVTGWILQFVGHGAFEGRAPALLDNLLQAIFLAPIFVWLELLFKLGYRPELKARVEKKVEAEIAKFRSQAGKKNGKSE